MNFINAVDSHLRPPCLPLRCFAVPAQLR